MTHEKLIESLWGRNYKLYFHISHLIYIDLKELNDVSTLRYHFFNIFANKIGYDEGINPFTALINWYSLFIKDIDYTLTGLEKYTFDLLKKDIEDIYPQIKSEKM